MPAGLQAEASRPMDSISNVNEGGASSSSSGKSESPMDPDLFEAASERNIDSFDELKAADVELEQVAQIFKDTISHINMECQKIWISDSTEFVKQILALCPSLMRKSNVKEPSRSMDSVSSSKSESTMDPKLFKAAAEGKIEPFNKLKAQHVELEQIVTQPLKDTILHINIKCLKRRKSESTKFVEQILSLFPSLLLKPNAKGDTPLHVAAKCGLDTIVRVLIQWAKAKEKEIESRLRPEWEMLKSTNNDKNTALHEAIIFGCFDVVKTLTKEGDPEFPYSANNWGQTPLHLAAAVKDKLMVNAILEMCGSAAHEGPNGQTALHAAAKSFSSDTTERIIDAKMSLMKVTDEHGWTPLHYAAYYRRSLNAKVLLESDRSAAYIGDKDRKMTPLHLAASQGSLRTIKEIVFQCPECYELVDNRGWNVLHFAMLTLEKEELKDLFENPLLKSLINEKDHNGNAPIDVYEVVNKQNAAVEGVTRRGRLVLEQEIQELSKDVGKGQQYPYGVIRKSENNKEDEAVDGLDKTRESHLVVATLIATVTFAAAFTVPGGYNSDKDSPNPGTAILSKKSAFQAFIISDTIAMTLSLSAVFIHLFLAIQGLGKFHKMCKFLFIATSILTTSALQAMMIAFATGTYAVLPPSSRLAIAVGLIGLIYVIAVSLAQMLILKDIYRAILNKMAHWRKHLTA